MLKIIEQYPHLKAQSGEVGIEIEMEGTHLPTIVPGWKVVKEGSLHAGGKEYVFALPVSRHYVPTKLDTLKEEFKAAGSVLNPSLQCGIHVHLNVQQYTYMQVLTFICLYLVFERTLVKWCGAEREGNLFCLRAEDADFIIEKLIKSRQTNSFRNVLYPDQLRYASINLDALSKYGSLEFRAMYTPVDFVGPTLTWLKVLLAIKDASERYSEPKEIVEALSEHGPIAFAEAILGEMYQEFATPTIEQEVMAGVRLIQDVAYAPAFFPPAPKVEKKVDIFEIDAKVDWIELINNAKQAVVPPLPPR